jgi:plasmid maintenance system antidote protein VapI
LTCPSFLFSPELAEKLGIKPKGITEIFKGRNQPTGEQVLVMLELLKRRK